ncbi:MAG: hypothetical protein ACOCUH_04440, partial [Bacteriovoracia bacterium]
MKKTVVLSAIVLIVVACGKVNSLAPFDHETELGSSYAQVHSKVKEVPDDIEYNIRYYPSEEHLKDLVDYLMEDGGTTQVKAKIIHDW